MKHFVVWKLWDYKVTHRQSYILFHNRLNFIYLILLIKSLAENFYKGSYKTVFFKVIELKTNYKYNDMENKSKKNASIFMIFGGLLVLGNHLLKLENDKHYTNNIIIIVCVAIFTIFGIISLRNTIKKTTRDN